MKSCTPRQVEEYCRPNAQGGPPPGYGGQLWKLVDRQAECMPPLGQCGHMGQWAGGQSNCPPPPHGHYKQQGQWAASHQGQWNNYCEGMATNHHGHANWDGLGGCCRGSIQAGWASGFGVYETNIQGEKMPATTEELQEPSSRSNATTRTQQRVAKKTIEFEAEERKKKGMPPHKVEVTKHGKIDGSCDGKNDWDNAMRGLAPRILNMAVVKVGEQNPVDMAKLRRQLDDLFEYIHHELSARGFRDCVRRFMKNERSRLKKWYQKDGQTGCPLGVDADQWAALVKYWEERNT